MSSSVTRLVFTSLVWLLALAPQIAFAQTKPVAVVARVAIDPAISRSTPASFTTILRRELEHALQASDLFVVPVRDPVELERILDEIERTRQFGAAHTTSADFVVLPTIVSFEFTQRRRPAPYNRERDVITTVGSLSLDFTVSSSRSSSGPSRFQISVDYRGEPVMVDAGRAGTTAASEQDYVELARDAGRRLTARLRERNAPASSSAASSPGGSSEPVLVADRSGARVWLAAGPRAGYSVGSELRVFAPGGRQILHPETGAVLGVAEEQIGKVRVVELQSQLIIAEIIEETESIVAGATVHP